MHLVTEKCFMVIFRRMAARSIERLMVVLWTGQVIAQDLNDEDEFLDTPEASTAMDNTLMGYTIAVGHFNNDSIPGQ